MSEEILDDLGVGASAEKESGSGVPEIVEADTL
jgi:hypothetical protein